MTRVLARIALWLTLGAGVCPAAAGPAIQIVERERLVLTLRPLTATAVETDPAAFRLELDGPEPAELEFHLLWPDPDRPSRLRFAATLALTSAGPRVRLEAELFDAAGRGQSRASREILFTSDRDTALFEVAREGQRVLTLAVDGELSRTKSYAAHPVLGSPVLFELEIQWMERGQGVTLETNRLHTFVGQGVSYSFKLGETGEAESIRLHLMPAQRIGDTLRIEVEVSGTLPNDGESLSVIGRKEQWVATSHTTSTLSLASGEPPTGFVFLVTPRF